MREIKEEEEQRIMDGLDPFWAAVYGKRTNTKPTNRRVLIQPDEKQRKTNEIKFI